MRRFLTILATAAILAVLAIPAGATIDNGDGTCIQSDGAVGIFNGTTSDDAGCVTPAEYAETWTVDNLVEAGVLDGAILNDDGSVTGILASSGVAVTFEADPLDRPVAANTNPASPAYEPDAPTVRDWFDVRLAQGVHPL